MIVAIIMLIIMIGFFVTILPSLIALFSPLVFTPEQTLIINLFGVVILAIAPIILLILAKRSSAIHLIDFPKPGQVLWLYVMKGGMAYFVPSVRMAQAFLYSKGRGIVKDVGENSRISIGRHNVRIVLEKVGHTINPYIAQYASRLRRKYGFKDIKQARNAGRFIHAGIVKKKDIEEYAKKKNKFKEPYKVDEEDLKSLGIDKREEIENEK